MAPKGRAKPNKAAAAAEEEPQGTGRAKADPATRSGTLPATYEAPPPTTHALPDTVEASGATPSRKDGHALVMILSPAKTMDFKVPSADIPATAPRLMHHSIPLAKELAKLSKSELKTLLGVSAALADLNYERYSNFNTKTPTVAGENAKQAVLAFTGAAYQGLEAKSLSVEELKYAQNHLRILDGLYGVLRPLDIIQPYRLEMNTKMPSSFGGLGSLVADLAAGSSESKNEPILVNLASAEYSAAVKFDDLPAGFRVVHVVFKDGGMVKAFLAKKARGMMTRYIIKNRVETFEALKDFAEGGYKLDARASNDTTLTFTRGATSAQAKRKAKGSDDDDDDETPDITQGEDDEEGAEDVPKKRRTNAYMAMGAAAPRAGRGRAKKS